MVGHFIRYKGKGAWVFGMPFLISFILFVIASVCNADDKYIRDATLIISSVILLLIDNNKEIITDGVIQRTGKRAKGLNTFMWIEMRYWAIVMGVLGVILLMLSIT